MGHHLGSKSSIVPLIDRLNKYPIGLVDSDKLREILSLLFDEREAFVASRFPLEEAILPELVRLTKIPEGELLPLLDAAAPSRIVNLSSASHWTGAIHWDDLQLAEPGAYDAVAAYDQSKLAVTMLTLELAHRLRDSGTTAVCLDPGDVATRMLALGWPDLPGIPVESGAVTSVYLASAAQAGGLSGVYVENGRPVEPPPPALDPKARARLWREVERLCGPLHV